MSLQRQIDSLLLPGSPSLPLAVYDLSVGSPFQISFSSLTLCPPLWFFPPSPAVLRWTWRWLCLVKGKIRPSRCPCSGCPWSVFRCCWMLCQVTSTRSPKTLFRLWTSSRGICLPWGTNRNPPPNLPPPSDLPRLSAEILHFIFNLTVIPSFPAASSWTNKTQLCSSFVYPGFFAVKLINLDILSFVVNFYICWLQTSS